MSEVDSTIARSLKSPVIAPLDLGAQLMTLAEFKRLGVLSKAAAQKATREQQLFDQDAAVSHTLSSLKDGTFRSRTPAAAPAPGRPGVPQPGTVSSTDAVVTGPVGDYDQTPVASSPAPAAPPRQRSIMDQDVQAELYRLAPNVASGRIKEAMERYTESLKGQAATFESIARGLVHATDEPSYQAFLLTASTMLPPEMVSKFPQTYPGPEGVAKIVQNAKSLADTFKERIEAGNLAVSQQGADTAAFTAETQRGARIPGTTATGETIMIPTYAPSGGQGATPGGEVIPNTARPWGGDEIQAHGLHQQMTTADAVLRRLETTTPGGPSGRVQQGVSQLPWGANWSQATTQEFNQARDSWLTALNGGTPPDAAKRAAWEQQYFAKPGETNPSVLAQKQADRQAAMRTVQARTNRPAGVTPPGLRPLQRPGAQEPVRPGEPGPPPAGQTRYNTTLDGKPLSVDARTPEEAERFLRQQYPGRAFMLTPETGTAAAPPAGTARPITPDDITKAQGFAHAKGETWTPEQARAAIDAYRQSGKRLPWEPK